MVSSEGRERLVEPELYEIADVIGEAGTEPWGVELERGADFGGLAA